MEIYISSISSGGDCEVVVTVEQRANSKRNIERFLLPISAYSELALTVGASDEATYELLERESHIYGAYKHSLYMLSFGAKSKRMLFRKLVIKGFDPEISRVAIARVEANGMLDENASALREAEKCLEKLWGERRIRAHLIDKGYAEEAIENAFFSIEDSGVDFDILCAELIEKKYRQIPKDKKEMQKLVAALERYGYPFAQIKRAIALKR